MAWNLTGKIIEACSCKMVCRCIFGPAQPDMGWCSAGQVLVIERGSAEGVNLSGTKAAIALQLPGDFFGGVEVARLYVDAGVSPEQRAHLEAIFHGERGGVWAALKEAIGKWLPTQTARIQAETGDSPSFRVEGVAEARLERLKTEDGRQATVSNAPVSSAFEIETLELATAAGARWSDPDMRAWESGGFGAVEAFNWSA